MDDHNPKGILTNESPNVFHPAPSPYGIPYRSLYSKNISNLFFAGRNISATHAAMSSTRVMATCALLGQAVGTAAAVANTNGTSPRGVLEDHLRELQRALMDDDCYLPDFLREPSELMRRARIETTGSFAEKLRNGAERPIGDEENAWVGKSGDTIDVFFDEASEISRIRMVFDSDLNREHIGGGGYMDRKATLCNVKRDTPLVHLPTTLVKSVRVFVSEDGENFSEIGGLRENRRRLAYVPIGRRVCAVRLLIDETHGDSEIRIFSVDVI